ncbi:MAG: zinc-binding dehydrogenase [Gammaproteobacteria bacterium]|nr:zinc-binding dehydrogenase [Gammaproteobacteria bacterium]
MSGDQHRQGALRPTVVVFGCGGVGLSAIQGARLVGARRIIAVDPLESKLEYARHFGATHTVNAGDDPVAAVRELSGGWVRTTVSR